MLFLLPRRSTTRAMLVSAGYSQCDGAHLVIIDEALEAVGSDVTIPAMDGERA